MLFSKQPVWCCLGFRGHFVGTTVPHDHYGYAVTLEDDDGKRAFRMHSQVVFPPAAREQPSLEIGRTTVTTGLQYCPWCGEHLLTFYKTTLASLAVERMKFFTRQWYRSDDSDREAVETERAYQQHIVTLDLPPSARELAAQWIHDALIMTVDHQPRNACLLLRLRCGDLQQGYFDVSMVFLRCEIDAVDLRTLREAARPALEEILCHEIDRSGDRFEYRILFDTHREVAIRFQDVEITRQSVPNRDAP